MAALARRLIILSGFNIKNNVTVHMQQQVKFLKSAEWRIICIFKPRRGQETTIGGMGIIARDLPSVDPPSTFHF